MRKISILIMFLSSISCRQLNQEETRILEESKKPSFGVIQFYDANNIINYERTINKAVYNGHEYIGFAYDRSFTFTHNPDCNNPKCNKIK